MIGLVMVSHGGMAHALLEAVAHVVGPMRQASAIAIGPDDDMEAMRAAIDAQLRANDSGDGVIIMTDLFGGTPSNLAISLMKPGVEVIAGFNLPMAIRFAGARNRMSLADAAAAVRDAGRKYISRAADVLAEEGASVAEEPPPHDPDRTKRLQMIAGLSRVADELAELRVVLRSEPPSSRLHGQLGHNLPPPAFDFEDDAVLTDGEIASRVAALETQSTEPRSDILRLCISTLNRVLSLLKQLAQWALTKADVFAEAAAKSAGKATGPAIIAGSIAAGLAGRLSELIDYLRAAAGL